MTRYSHADITGYMPGYITGWLNIAHSDITGYITRWLDMTHTDNTGYITGWPDITHSDMTGYENYDWIPKNAWFW